MTAPVVFCHLYELVPRAKLGSAAQSGSRKGALLRVRFEDRKTGYADCHPWPELGDLALSLQIDLLKKNQLTELTQKSIEFARIDAEARANHRSLWDGLQVPSSHALMTDLRQLNAMELEGIAHQGYTHLKIKLGSQPAQEARLLQSLSAEFHRLGFKLRLDFNGALENLYNVDQFLAGLGRARECIDYLEDPTSYQADAWEQIQKKWGVRLALDRISNVDLSASHRGGQIPFHLKPGSFSVLVFKPAIQREEWALEIAKQFQTSIVVTSYLDHPLGQLSAAWTAARLKAAGSVMIETCGLLSQTAYQFHPFAGQVLSKKSVLTPPAGYGFGMDELLANLEWLPLKSSFKPPLEEEKRKKNKYDSVEFV